MRIYLRHCFCRKNFVFGAPIDFFNAYVWLPTNFCPRFLITDNKGFFCFNSWLPTIKEDRFFCFCPRFKISFFLLCKKQKHSLDFHGYLTHLEFSHFNTVAVLSLSPPSPHHPFRSLFFLRTNRSYLALKIDFWKFDKISRLEREKLKTIERINYEVLLFDRITM